MTTAFDVVVLSDTLGRECRKPHPAPFRAALDLLEVDVDAAVFVGDRPDKDVMGAVGVGMRVVRVRTGEYRAQPDLVGTWASVPDVVAAIELVERMPLVRGATRAGPASVAGTGRGPGR
jgi:putative hydrolase of the HAD superfamily